MDRARSVPLPRGRVVSSDEMNRRKRASALFAGWLLMALHMNVDTLSLVPSTAGEVLSEYGRDLYICGGPQYLFTQSILSFGDEYPFLRPQLKRAWDALKQW